MKQKLLNVIPLKSSLLLIIVGLTVAVFVISLFSIEILLNNTNDILLAQAEENLGNKVDFIENELQAAEDISYQIFINRQLQEYLAEVKDEELSRYSLQLLADDIEHILYEHVFLKRYVKQIELMDFDGNLYYVQNNAPNDPDFLEDNRLVLDEVLTEGSVYWSYEYPDRLHISRNIRRYSPMMLDNIGKLSIQISMNSLVADAIDKEYDNFLILDSKKNLIFGSEAMYKKLDNVNLDNYETYVPNKSDNQYFISHAKSKYNGWIYVDFIDVSQINKNSHFVYNAIIVFSILCIICVLIALALFYLRVSRTLLNIVHQIKHVKNTSALQILNKEIENLRNTQISALYKEFYDNILEIDEHIRAEYEMKLDIKKKEYLALQAQINPHFLYNILDSVNWIAKKNKQNQLSQVIETLGDYLRSIMSLKKQMVTLEQELNLVKDYIALECFRFGDRLVLKINVDPIYHNIILPKMTLQPIIENSVKHVMRACIKPCIIMIKSKFQNNILSISITDNGPGIDEATISKILNTDELKDSIGLNNINERLINALGQEYSLKIDSRLNHYTRVTINIPVSYIGGEYNEDAHS